MWLYLIIFAIPVLAFYNGPLENRNKRFLLIYMLALMLFVGLSDMFGGYDRYIYGEVFDNIADAITYDLDRDSIIAFQTFEKGFTWITTMIASISENRYIYIFIITMLIYFFIYKAFERSMTNYPFACIIFLGLIFFFSFTYLRQILGCSIAWFGLRYYIDKKWFKFFIILIIVFLMHKSGIVFAGLLFLPLKKWQPMTIILIMIVCASIGLSGITGSLYDAYVEASDIGKNIYNTSDTMRLPYILEVIFFVWLILINYDKILPTRKNLIFLNTALSFCAILLLFVKSSTGGRMSWYFAIGIIYIVTVICTYQSHSKSLLTSQTLVKNQKWIRTLMILLMLVLYIRIYIGWQSGNYLYPYKTFLTKGHRYPDPMWETFEYDLNYDEDKFYRPAFRFLDE